MNWITIERDELIKAVDVLNLVPQRAGIPSSDYIRCRTMKKGFEFSLASSVRSSVWVKAPLVNPNDFTGEFFVDRRLFIPFILAGRTWKGDFRTAFDEKGWLLRQGSRRANFALKAEPVGGYGEWIDIKSMKEVKLSAGLTKLLLASFNCATSEPSMPQLNCVYMGGNLVMATNTTTMFVGLSQQMNGMRFPFPIEIIPLLGGGLVEGVCIEAGQVLLDCGCGFIQGTVSAVAQKSFPKGQIVEQVKKARQWPTLARLPAERIAKMMGRLTEYLSGIRREDWMLRLEMGEGKVHATVRVMQGKFEEVMTVEDLKKEGAIEWPLEQVRSVLEYMGQTTETIRIRVDEEKKSPYLISGGSVELMVARKKV